MFFDKKSNGSVKLFTKCIAVFMSVIIFCLLTGAVIDVQTKRITLVMVDAFTDTEKTRELTTRQNLVGEFLEENNVEIGEFDKVSMLYEDELYDEARIIVRKGRKFTLNIDGNIEIITTTKKSIREAFEEAGVSVSQADIVEPNLDSEVIHGMEVDVFRIAHSRITEDVEIPFTAKEVSDNTLVIESNSYEDSPCRISMFGPCINPVWKHYVNNVLYATGRYEGTIPSDNRLVIDATEIPYSITERGASGAIVADRYQQCDFNTERFFHLQHGSNRISVSHEGLNAVPMIVEGKISYETV